ncbi:MAG: hypothetical protein OES13_12115 [Acidimicrobiia bacterium]|nr:hypothetical protein [Acidimicrobiia bacterium]
MVVVAYLVAAGLAIMLGAVGWAATQGTMRETAQERIDREFHRIVERLRSGDA